MSLVTATAVIVVVTINTVLTIEIVTATIPVHWYCINERLVEATKSIFSVNLRELYESYSGMQPRGFDYVDPGQVH